MKKVSIVATFAVLLMAGSSFAAVVTDNFDRADTTNVGTMSTPGYEWRDGVNGDGYVIEQDAVITNNTLGAELVSTTSPRDYRDTIFPAVTGGDVISATDGRIKFQIKNSIQPGQSINRVGYVINYRTMDTDVRWDTDPNTDGVQEGSNFTYSGHGGYHLTYMGDSANGIRFFLYYADDDGNSEYVHYKSFASSTTSFPTDPWIEAIFAEDQHTLTLYRNDGSTVYYTYTGTHTGRTEGHIGLTLDNIDSSLDGNPAAMAIDNFEMEYVPEPATMALLGMGGLALLKRRSR